PHPARNVDLVHLDSYGMPFCSESLARNVGNQIAKVVDKKNFTAQAVLFSDGLGEINLSPVGHVWTEQARVKPSTEVAGYRGQEIAAVKRGTDVRAPVMLVGKSDDTRRCRARQHAPAAIVRREQAMAAHFNIAQRPLGADAWIDHHHVQRLRRKVRDGTVQEKS